MKNPEIVVLGMLSITMAYALAGNLGVFLLSFLGLVILQDRRNKI